MKLKRSISLLLCAAMILSLFGAGGISAFAKENDELRGRVIAKGDIDVSGIKIDISIEEPLYTEDGNPYYSYAYAYSVYTDSKGEYSSVMPSENCSVDIDLDTLPEKTGYCARFVKIDGSGKVDDLVIAEIADIDVDEDYCIGIRDADGDGLIANIDISTEFPDIDIGSVNGNFSLEKRVTVNANGFVKTKSIEVIPASADLVTKADKLYYLQLISETDRARLYLEALKTGSYSSGECGTRLDDVLADYSCYGEDRELTEEIDVFLYGNKFARSDMPEGVDYSNPKTRAVSNSKIAYTLNYESNISAEAYITEEKMDRIEDYVKDIIDFYYVTYNFKTPMLQPGYDSYQIYFISGLDDVNGRTKGFKDKITGEPKGSYILINAGAKDEDDIKRTLAHEIFHSIMLAYTSGEKITGVEGWLREAAASYAGLRYLNKYSYWAKGAAAKYLETTSHALCDLSNDRNYGLFLFAQYLDQGYGGMNAVKRTLEYISSGDSVLNAMEKATQATTNPTAYEKLFVMFQCYNADPRRYENSDGKYKPAEFERNDSSGGLNIKGVQSTAAMHYGLDATSDSTNLTINITITSGSYKSARFNIVKFPGDGGASTIDKTYVPTGKTLTIPVYSFKQGTTDSDFPHITLVASNIVKDYSDIYSFYFTYTYT